MMWIWIRNLIWTLFNFLAIREQQQEKRLMLVGQTGSGKSSLGNTLLNTDDFTVCHNIDSCTIQVQVEKGNLFGNNNTGIQLSVSDTGGLGDTEGRDEEFADDIASHIRYIGGVHGILFVFNACDTRLHDQARKALMTLVQTITNDDNKDQLSPRLSIVMTQCTGATKRLLWGVNLPPKLCKMFQFCNTTIHWYDDHERSWGVWFWQNSPFRNNDSWREVFTEWVQNLPQEPMNVPSETEREKLKKDHRENTDRLENKVKEMNDQMRKLAEEITFRQKNGLNIHYVGKEMKKLKVAIEEAERSIRGCFSGTSKVIDRNLGKVSIMNLKIGSEVATDSGWATINTFLHWHPKDTVPAIQITHAQGNLTLSPLHLLFIIDNDGNTNAIAANQLNPGDLLLTASHTSIVHDVKATMMQGYSAPITSSGTILVDDIVASCYMHDGYYNLPHWVLHLLAVPLRMTPQSLSYMPTAGSIHPFVRLLHATS